jgi:hypothetical protein
MIIAIYIYLLQVIITHQHNKIIDNSDGDNNGKDGNGERDGNVTTTTTTMTTTTTKKTIENDTYDNK